MRKTCVAGLVLGMVLVLAPPAAAKVKPKPAPLKVQSTLDVQVDQSTGLAVASGYVKVASKKVPVRWFVTITKYDAQNNICGAKPMHYQSGATSFKVKLPLPGGFKVIVTMKTTKKYNGRFYSKTKTFNFDLGAADANCVRLTTIPDASRICDWAVVSNCGTPITGGPAWLSKPLKDGNVIVSGEVGSPSASCSKDTPKDAPTSYSWLGNTVQVFGWKCSDGYSVIISVAGVWLQPPGSNTTCQGSLPNQGWGIGSFQIPPDWGGSIDVVFSLTVFAPGGQVLGAEYSSAIIDLGAGGVDGCAQLTASG